MKPRDFKATPKLLTEIGAANYDAGLDLADLKIDLENKVEKLREQWKCYDPEKLKMLIRRQVILELTRIEERKKVRAEVELAAKRKAEEDEEDEADVGAMNRSGGSPQKGGGVAFEGKSSISSPTKLSPKKSFAPSESATDAMSVSMASKASPGAGIQKLLGGGGIEAILASHPATVASGLTSGKGIGSKALQKLDRGGVAAGPAKSIAGRSVGSRATRRTGTMSRAGSRKSKAENDVAEMEIEEIEAIIEEREASMKQLLKEKNSIMKKARSMTAQQLAQKTKPIEDDMHELR